MAADQRSLNDLRKEIDAIDGALQDLLIQRTSLAQSIAAAKGDTSVFIRPGREAQVVRRLVARHSGAFPKAALVRLWRDIISAVTALQGPFAVAVCTPPNGPDLRALARDHFGAVTPFSAFESAMGVLRAVSEGKATVGVLPLPQSDEQESWWRALARGGDDTPRIVARLPFAPSASAQGDDAEALVVAQTGQEESGRDRSYLVLETAEELSRDALGQLLASAELAVVDVKHTRDLADHRLDLIEVEGYLAAEDPRLERLSRGHAEQIRQYWLVGGYAVPFSAEELAAEPAEAPA
ncbi:MAG: chorismate mutase [Pseudomonadota bacterium]